MDEQQQRELFARLQQILTELRLSWINDQVNEQVQSGKLVNKDVQMVKEIDDRQLSGFANYRPSGKPQRMVGIEPYSFEEQLFILLDAIEKSMVDIAAMQGEIARFFKSQERSAQRPPAEIILDQVEGVGKVSLPLDEVADSSEIQQLQALIAQIRSQINS